MNLPCFLFKVWCATSGTLIGPATIVDGDTIIVERQGVRLAGIDAEELNEPHGVEARRHLESLITGYTVACQWNGFSYKRVVGVCRVQGMPPGVAEPGQLSLNAQMIADGYALDCAHYSRGVYRSLEPAGARMKLIQKLYCILK